MRTEAPAAIATNRTPAVTKPRETVPWLPSGVRFVGDDGRRALLLEAARCRFVIVDVADGDSRSLRDAVEEGVEMVLAHRGAVPPSVELGASAARVVRDQHARLRASAARGILLALPPLTGRVEDGALPVDDGVTLASWMRLALDDAAPTVLVAIREEDRAVPVLVPRPLGDVVDDDGAPPAPAAFAMRIVPSLAPTTLPPPVERAQPAPVQPACAGPASAEPASAHEADGLLVALETSALPSTVTVEPVVTVQTSTIAIAVETGPSGVAASESVPGAASSGPASSESAITSDVWAHADELIAHHTAPADLGPLDPPEPSPVPEHVAAAPARAGLVPAAARRAEAPVDDDDGGLGLDDRAAAPAARPLRDLREVFDEALRVDTPLSSRPAPSCDRPVERAESTTGRARDRAAQRVATSAAWRAHALELESAKGPKPLAVVHDLFASHYVPLLGAMARGELDGTVRAIVEEWRQSFAQSYINAFASMRVTGKRPPMVLDAPDMAAKLGRTSGAKAVKLVLVDAMSWDLGKRVAARMGAGLGARGSLVEQQVLWSALPTTTPVQSFFLARGPNGLRDQDPPQSEPDVSRGRNVSSLRRERIGSRDVMKLDLVEARLRSPGDAYDERLEAIAEETAQVVSRFAETLPARTLLYVFGDHGFTLPPGGSGFLTGAAGQGGASPEEVLVGGFAWMIDAVH